MKKLSTFEGRTADNRKVRILATVGDPFLKIAVAGFGIRFYPKIKHDDLANMSKMPADRFFAKLH